MVKPSAFRDPEGSRGDSRHGLPLPLLVLGLATLLLAAGGGGVVGWALWPATVALLVGWISLRFRPGLGYGLFLLFLVVVGLTVVPLPLAVSRFMGGTRHDQNGAVARMVKEVATAMGYPPPALLFSLSRNRAGTLRVLVMATAIAAAAGLTAALSSSARFVWLRCLAGIAAAMAIAGMIGQYVRSQGATLWWVYPIPHGRSTVPTAVAGFVNRNHYAGFLGLAWPAAFVLAVRDAQRRGFVRACGMLCCATTIGAGVLLSQSRGGLVASAVGWSVLVLGLGFSRRWVAAVLALTTGLVAVALLFRWGPVSVRKRLLTLRGWNQTESFQIRATAWRDTLHIFRAYPVWGAGLEAFAVVYPQHRTQSAREVMTHAENEYLQLPAELGFVGMASLLAVLGLTVRRVIQGILREELPADLLVAVVPAGAAAAVHSGWDFCMRLPLYAVTLGSLVGLLLPVAPAAFPSAPRRPIKKWLSLSPPVLLLLLLAPFARSMYQLDVPAAMYRASLPELTRAMVWAPSWAYVWQCLAGRLGEHDSPEARRLGERCLSRAAQLDPQNYRLWYDLGRYRLSLEDREGARAAFERARQLRPWLRVPPISYERP